MRPSNKKLTMSPTTGACDRKTTASWWETASPTQGRVTRATGIPEAHKETRKLEQNHGEPQHRHREPQRRHCEPKRRHCEDQLRRFET